MSIQYMGEHCTPLGLYIAHLLRIKAWPWRFCLFHKSTWLNCSHFGPWLTRCSLNSSETLAPRWTLVWFNSRVKLFAVSWGFLTAEQDTLFYDWLGVSFLFIAFSTAENGLGFSMTFAGTAALGGAPLDAQESVLWLHQTGFRTFERPKYGRGFPGAGFEVMRRPSQNPEGHGKIKGSA